MLASEVRALLTVMEDPQADMASLRCCASQLLSTALESDLTERQAALEQLARVFSISSGSQATCLAVICGALIEHGCPPDPLASPLFLRIGELLPRVIKLYDLCAAQIPKSTSAADHDSSEAQFLTVLEQHRDAFPALCAAWNDLDHFAPAVIAVLSTSPQWRNMAHCFQEPLKHIMDHHQAARWLVRLLAVVEGALLLIEPATCSGWQARMSGIADNYQLQTLVLATLNDNSSTIPVPNSSTIPVPPSAGAVDVARGIGPQQSPDEVSGRWDFYSWQAIQPDLQLPRIEHPLAQKYKIIDAGLPAEIPMFAGQRVLLLGPRTQRPRWVSQRPFGHLKADLHYERALSSASCRDWLQRMYQQSLHQ